MAVVVVVAVAGLVAIVLHFDLSVSSARIHICETVLTTMMELQSWFDCSSLQIILLWTGPADCLYLRTYCLWEQLGFESVGLQRVLLVFGWRRCRIIRCSVVFVLLMSS